MKVGILGGMGPDATVDIMRRILAKTPARVDEDHLRLLVDLNPRVPSRIKALIEETGPSPAPVLIEMARGLINQGADFLLMPCNTVHFYHEEIVAGMNGVPLLHMPALVADMLRMLSPKVKRVGILASSALSKIKLYEKVFGNDFDALYPDIANQDAVMGLIHAVKAGPPSEKYMDGLRDAASDLENQGAEVLLIACTELSVVADRLTSTLPVYDAADILAEAVVQRAKSE